MIPFAPLLLIMSAASQAPASDGDPWQWNSDTPICALRQTSASGDMIEVSRTPGNEETEIKITFRSHPQVREGRFPDGAIRVDPRGEAAAAVATQVNDTKRLEVYAVTAEPAFISQFSNASAVQIANEKIGSFVVPLRSAGAATDALRNCEDRKMRDWGIDPVAWRALKSRPIPLKPVRDRFSALDYPAAAAAASVEADAITRLDVAADGRITHCGSLNVGEYKGFERAACDVLRGARFQPALDTAGNAVAALYVFDVRFRLAH